MKIVCTLGPAVASLEGITGLVNAGMDVARPNFSRGEHEDYARDYRWVCEAPNAMGHAVGTLADLQGLKIRLGHFRESLTCWVDGEIVRITVDDIEDTHDRVSVTYKNLTDGARPGDRLLADDGKVGLECTEVDDNDVVCRVIEDGPVSDNKGVSLPGMNTSVPALSEKDIADLHFALKLGVDLIALSFVRPPPDVELVHAVTDRVGRRAPIVAKLKKPEATESLETIILVFDAVMVVHGDLGVEVLPEDVPLIQKCAIQVARENIKSVIVTTQIFDPMISNSCSARTEASDVADVVLDGADAVMLPGKTSIGKYPQAMVKTMARIVTVAECEGEVPTLTHMPRMKRGVISYVACDTSERLNARTMAAFTTPGDTVRRVTRLHSRPPLLVSIPNQQVRP